MANYLVTYTPLAASSAGLRAVERFGHPPYADASCRRTPDFEAKHPSISAVCRGRNFAPRLHVGDVVVYMTKQGRYDGPDPHWRLVAVLRVRQRFETHSEAAAWHREAGLPLPSDCIVEGNPPLPVEHTNGPNSDLEEWDAWYAARIRDYGTFLVCDPLWMDLYAPPVVSRKLLTEIFGTIPATRTPPPITEDQVRRLLRGAGGGEPNGSHVRRPAKSSNLVVRASERTSGTRSSGVTACGGRASRKQTKVQSGRGC